MQLNLKSKGRLSVSDSIFLDRIAPDVDKEFNYLTACLVKDNNLKVLSLLSSIVSRNPLQSPMLSVLYRVALLEEKLKKGDNISLIIIDDPAMLPIIEQIMDKFDKNISIRKDYIFFKSNLFFLLIYRLLKALYQILLSYFWVRLTKTKKIIPKGLNVLVDSFILTDSFNKEGEFSDRYYTGYENYLSPEQISRIRYIPTLHGFRTLSQLISMSASAKKYKNKFIFQESWLSFYDYFFALFQTVILSFKIKNTPYFRGVNIHQLFVRESKKDIFSPSFMMAICKYRFIKKMRVEGVGVCHVLNWNENQNIDKALNLAIHEFYPGISVKGYQGYASSLHEVHKIPQEYELDNLTFPDELHVISKKIQGIVSSNCPKINVKLASAFRFSYLYDINRKKSVPGIPTILIALPMDIDESTNILNACSQLHSLVNTKISILVKHHPAHESHTFAKRVPVFRNDAFTPTNDSMFDLLGFISLLISSASSVCVEAASLGIPVAIHGNRHGVTMNPVTDVHNHKDNVFYSQEQLGKFVDSSLQKNSQKISIEHSFFMDNGESAQALFVCE